jgi:hypothetical protein
MDIISDFEHKLSNGIFDKLNAEISRLSRLTKSKERAYEFFIGALLQEPTDDEESHGGK